MNGTDRVVDVRKQKALSLDKSLSFCMKGISHRLLRSSLTLAVVVLAVAFFMTLLSESVLLKSAAKLLDSEIAQRREATVFMSKLYSPLTPVAISETLASISGDKKAIEEMARVTGLKPEKVQSLAESCNFEIVYLDFFERLGVGQRHILVKKNKGRDIFRHLSDERNFRQFCDMLEPLRTLKLPSDTGELKSFTANYPRFEKELLDFSKRHEAKVNTLKAATKNLIMDSTLETWLCAASRDEVAGYCQLRLALGGAIVDQDELAKIKAQTWRLQSTLRNAALSQKAPASEVNIEARLKPSEEELKTMLSSIKPDAWLCFAPQSGLDSWRGIVSEAGFNVDSTRIKRIIESLREEHAKDDIAELLSSKEMKAEWKKRFMDNPSIDRKMEMLTNSQVAQMLAEDYNFEQLKNAESMAREERRSATMERELSGRVDAKSGGVLSGRQVFLLGVSFLVCMVGIANAMLMAITERFREIATMKCLGATDGFILTQFLIEAALQGVCGGAVGMVIGLLLSILKAVLGIGPHVLAGFPFFGVIVCAFASMAAGVALSMLASIYPSWKASRMAPMEAMRVE